MTIILALGEARGNTILWAYRGRRYLYMRWLGQPFRQLFIIGINASPSISTEDSSLNMTLSNVSLHLSAFIYQCTIQSVFLWLIS